MINILPDTLCYWGKMLLPLRDRTHPLDFGRLPFLGTTFRKTIYEDFLDCYNSIGFTVIELMVAVALLGILASVALPNISSEMSKYRLNGATHQIFGHLMASRMKAVSLNRKVKIYFINDNQYNICDDSDQDETVDNCEGNARLINIQDNYKSVFVTSNNNPIFHPRGTASNLATISIENSSGTRTITIAITGRIQVN